MGQKNINNNGKIRNWLSILGTVGISASIVAGASVAIWYSTSDYTLNSEYGSSINLRYELDTSTTSDDPLSGAGSTNTKSVKELTEDTARSFSRYLNNLGVETYNSVYPEYYELNGVKKAYINFTIPRTLVQEREMTNGELLPDADKKVDVPLLNAYFSSLNSNRVDIIIDSYYDRTATNNPNGFLAIASSEQLFDSNNDITLDYSTNTLNLKVSTTDDSNHVVADDFNNFYKKVVKDDSETASADKKKWAMYVIRDKESLKNRMHFILQAASYHYGSQDRNAYDETSLETAWVYLSDSEKKWADAVLGEDNDRKPFKDAYLSTSQGTLNVYRTAHSLLQEPTTFTSGNNTNWGPDEDATFYRLITFSGETYSNYDGSLFPYPHSFSTSGDWIKGWMKPYIVVNPINDETGFKTLFPDKNPNNSEDKSDDDNVGKYLALSCDSKFELEQLKKSLTGDYNFSLPIKGINQIQEETTTYAIGEYINYGGENVCNKANPAGVVSYVYNSQVGVTNNSATFYSGLFISNPLLASFIALMVVLFLIGVFISVFYRVPGLIAFFSIVATLFITTTVFLLALHTISFALFIALTLGTFLSMFSYFLICQKVKKHLEPETAMAGSVKKGLFRSVLPVIDMHIVTIILAACMMFFGINIINELGIALMICGLVSLAMVAVWSFAVYLLFFNKVNAANRAIFIPKFLTKNLKYDVNNTIKTEVYNPSFAATDKFEKVVRDKLWKNILAGALIAATVIAGIIILCLVTIGGVSSYYQGTRISILNLTEGDGIVQAIQSQLANGGWVLSKEVDLWVLSSTQQFDYNQIIEALKAANLISAVIGTDYLVQTEVVGGIVDAVENTEYLFLIATGFLCAYALVRCNYTSVIPVFAQLICFDLFMNAAFILFNIKLDDIVLVFACLAFGLNAIFTFTFVNNLNSSWIKSRYLNKKKLTEILDNEIMSNINSYFLYVVCTIFGACLVLAICSPVNLSLGYAVVFVCFIGTLLINYSVTKLLLKVFIQLRHKYKVAVIQGEVFFQKNYDKVDEQHIEGINRFKNKTFNIEEYVKEKTSVNSPANPVPETAAKL